MEANLNIHDLTSPKQAPLPPGRGWGGVKGKILVSVLATAIVFLECEGTLINSYPQVRELSEDAHLYGALEVKDNLIIMHEKTPPFLDIRGFSMVNVGQNIIELVKPHDMLAIFSDCKEIHLSPQLILGVHDTPKVLLQRVTSYSGEGWVESQR